MNKWLSQGSGSLALAIILALGVRWLLVEAYVIPSGSMLPTLLVNDHIFVNKSAYGIRVPFTSDWLLRWSQPQRGEVVVFKYPADPKYYYIKRVIGVPGDYVEYRKGYLYINGELVERVVPGEHSKVDWQWLGQHSFWAQRNQIDDYTHWQEALGDNSYSVMLNQQGSLQIEFEPYRVPQRHFFVMGDNRDNSQDSRHWSSDSKKARGSVELELMPEIEREVMVPAGTVVKTLESAGLSLRFRTLKDTKVAPKAKSEVEIEALQGGLDHNLSANKIQEIESEALNGIVIVNNPEAVNGGNDFRYVPESYIVGRAMFVWLSCDRKLPILSFLCDPTSLRWGRFFNYVD